MYTKRTHTIIWSAIATAVAVGAVMQNPGHLFTAAIIFAFAIECGPSEREDVR